MTRRRTISIIILIIAVAAVFLIYSQLTPSEERQETGKIVNLQKTSLMSTVEGTGHLKMPHYSELRFKGDTTLAMKSVDRVFVEEGDYVKKGDILATLDTTELERNLRNQELALKNAELNLDKVKSDYDADSNYEDYVREMSDNLRKSAMNQVSTSSQSINTFLNPNQYYQGYKTPNIPPATVGTGLMTWGTDWLGAVAENEKSRIDAKAQYDNAKEDYEDALDYQKGISTPRNIKFALLDVQTAELNYEKAKQDIEDAELVAPFDGYINNITIKEGDRVDLGSSTMTLVNPEILEIDVIVDEIDALKIKPGQKAIITFDALPGREFLGEVKSVATIGKIEAGVVTYDVKIKMRPPDVELKDSLTAYVKIIIKEGKDALWVPTEAIKMTDRGPVVTVVVNGQKQDQRVILGETFNGMTEIKDGVLEGEDIFVPE